MKKNDSHIVYSTDPNFKPEENEEKPIYEKSHILRLSLDRKQRAGKSVTVIEGFKESIEDIESLAKQLKSKCATGGTVKDRKIEIQGDHRVKIETMLGQLGYKIKRIGG
jgi:translation initiation factor 1